MDLRKRFRDFRDWCPQPPDRLTTKLKHYAMPIAAVATATLILSASFFALYSSVMLHPTAPMLPLTSQASPLPDNWSMFLHDSAHTGFSTSSAPGTSAVLWTFSVGNNPLGSSPAVVNGLVYVGSSNGNIYCFNATTGELVWVNLNISQEVFSSPAVADGYVYFGSVDDSIYCLNAYTGALKWNFSAGSLNWIRSSPAVANGYVYIEASDGTVYCLNALTGAMIWSTPEPSGFCASSPAVANGYVYVGSWNSNIYCLNALSGAQVWAYMTGGPVVSSPSVSGNYVYVQSADGNLYCLSASSGTKLWSYPTLANTGMGMESSPVVNNGQVYVGSNNGNISCLNASTGARIWENTGFATTFSCAVAGGYVYIGANAGNFYCIDASNGATVWSVPIGPDDSAAVYDGVVYVGTGDSLVAFGTAPSAKVPSSHPSPLFSNNLLLVIGLLVAVAAVVVVIRMVKRPRLRDSGISGPIDHHKFDCNCCRYLCHGRHFNVQEEFEAGKQN